MPRPPAATARTLALAALSAALPAAGAAPVAPFEKGDRVVFVGDSITHGGSYHPDIYLYYATRFPDRPFVVYNAGIAGDTAPGTNARFDEDIAVHRPNVAAVMLGMNDAWADAFGPGAPTADMLRQREQSYDTYERAMGRLVASLRGLGCRLILIKPSLYDQTAALGAENRMGKDDQLVRFGGVIDALAAEHGAEVVDFHTLMSEINGRLQADDPAATLIGPDRVHPGEPGHFVMTYAFLAAQDLPATVSAIEIDAAAGAVVRQDRCAVAPGAAIASGGVAFTCTENALPFPVGPGGRPALDWVPFQERLNRQTLRVTGLEPGAWTLWINGDAVGGWSADELAAGIDLADHATTPQYRQALAVKAVNDARRAAVGSLRTIAHVRHALLSKADPAPGDADAVRAALDAQVAGAEGQPWHPYLRRQADAYLELAPHEAELRAEAEARMAEMWVVNQPRPHRWELTRGADARVR